MLAGYLGQDEGIRTLLPFSIYLFNMRSLPECRQRDRDDNILQIKHLGSFIFNVNIGCISRHGRPAIDYKWQKTGYTSPK
jgi:hypothetical protein